MNAQEFEDALKSEDINVPFEDILDFITARVYNCEHCGKQILGNEDQANFICWDCR